MRTVIALTLLILAAACSHQAVKKSPCVGIEKSPCARMPVNEGIA